MTGRPATVACTILAPHEYVSPRQRELTAGEHNVRQVAFALKKARGWAVREAAVDMAVLVGPDDVLVPVPDSRGSTRANHRLARYIARRSGSLVCDALTRRVQVPSSRQLRKAGIRPLTVEAHEMLRMAGCPQGRTVLVDNVVTTGGTAQAAAATLGVPCTVLAWAWHRTYPQLLRMANPAEEAKGRLLGWTYARKTSPKIHQTAGAIARELLAEHPAAVSRARLAAAADASSPTAFRAIEYLKDRGAWVFFDRSHGGGWRIAQTGLDPYGVTLGELAQRQALDRDELDILRLVASSSMRPDETQLEVVENPPRHTYQFWRACPNFNEKYGGEMVRYLVDHATQITYPTLARHVDFETLPDGRNHPALYRISRPDNWAISFWRSRLPSGQRVYYFDWSRMEHFFVEEEPDLAQEYELLERDLKGWHDPEVLLDAFAPIVEAWENNTGPLRGMHSGDACVEAGMALAHKTDVLLWGAGAGRVVMDGGGDTVLKLACGWTGTDQNRRECSHWIAANREQQTMLGEVIACDPDGRWLRMEKLEPLTDEEWVEAEAIRERIRRVADVGDDHTGNWGWTKDGRLVALDYGSEIDFAEYDAEP